jgi:hypothetical protein
MLSALFVLGLLAALSVGSLVLADDGCQPPELPCPPPPCDWRAGTPGFYQKAEHWGDITEVEIGGIIYTRHETIELLKSPVKGDKTITMIKAFLAAKLNQMHGCEDECIADTIAEADAWMALHPIGSEVKASSDAWQCGCGKEGGECLHCRLDAYNNGELCAPGCD